MSVRASRPVRGSVARTAASVCARVSAAGRRGDEGVAILVVIASMTVISLFLLTSLAYAVRNAEPGRRDQDSKIALAASQAGLDDYLSRLSADTNYWRNGNTDATNTALVASGNGRGVPGTNGAAGTYRYQLLSTASQTATTGQIRLRVTGLSSPGAGRTQVARTLTATLAPKSFLSYIYLSDVEVVDPGLLGHNALCANHYYANPDPRSARTDCSNINWVAGDVVNGPLHSNDALLISGAVRFESDQTESSWPAIQGAAANAKTWWGPATYPLGANPPRYAPPLSLPTGNTELLTRVAPDIDGDGQVGDGCYYTGATKIRFSGTRMYVDSPGTIRGDIPARCRPNTGAGLDIPPVVYVDSSADNCTAGALGYPAANEYFYDAGETAQSWYLGPNWHCKRGSAYVSGEADAQVTVTAKDDIVVTDNLTVQDSSSPDVIGLIAGNYVWVYHPIRNDGTNLRTTHVTEIDAAILALRRSFVVQYWNYGAPLGTLSVTGAIAQKFRGPVGTGGTTVATGYLKNYVHDARLNYLQPPYFLKPDTAPWRIAAVTDK